MTATMENEIKLAIDDFIEWAKSKSFDLQLSAPSFVADLDELAELDEFKRTQQKQNEGLRLEAMLLAIVGEYLRVKHNGAWEGEFSVDNSAANYYLTKVHFKNGVKVSPSRLIAQRLVEGKSVRSFKKIFDELATDVF